MNFFITLLGEYENIRNIGNETTQKNLNATLVKQIQVPLPPLEEQQEIIKTLSFIDLTINSAINSLESYKNIKSGLMPDLLTGKVRVKQTSLT